MSKARALLDALATHGSGAKVHLAAIISWYPPFGVWMNGTKRRLPVSTTTLLEVVATRKNGRGGEREVTTVLGVVATDEGTSAATEPR